MSKALEQLPKENIRALFTDLDGTVTADGRIEPGAFHSIWKLKEAGFPVVIVSGRPAGWADCLMRLLPLDAMVFENGAGVAVRMGQKIEMHTLAEDKNREEQQNRLIEVFTRLRSKVPQIKLAKDQSFRLYDFAIDFCEEPPNLSDAEVDLLLKELEKETDITAKLSNIHINYWCGKHTKVTACEYLLNTESFEKLTKGAIVFSGDSPNDEPLFQFFPNSVGMANIKNFTHLLKHPPTFVTSKEEGAGFEELVSYLLS